ncbi:hypothetical protein ASE25_06240 [Terrabacter sp. Root85]|uniref:hypothetical protein n=1 Tax=unclassified Terrabacter TaxID=2630222 RepID=UPI0006F8839F|nr:MULTISPECIES: hypothetical protein [unclassified Terrabacter]KRC92888.1 hypothetical protein ASE25_06240 [Terrabacter sp. Root85]KRF40050.1 hypothetical protein ASH01_19910 [Terrabacter sp. Soil811]
MSVTDVFPLIKAPDAWPVPVVATVAMVCLAGLDLLGAVLAKEWAENGSVRALVLGAGAFLVLFWVYASSLRYAELALVTMGWVVMLQVGLVLIDRWRYGVELPTGKWVAIGVVLVAQAYLVLAPAAEQAGAAAASGG